MKREDYIARWRHEVAGMVLDGAEQRTGPAYSLWCRQIMNKVDRLLGQQHDETFKASAPASNGATQKQGAKS